MKLAGTPFSFLNNAGKDEAGEESTREAAALSVDREIDGLSDAVARAVAAALSDARRRRTVASHIGNERRSGASETALTLTPCTSDVFRVTHVLVQTSAAANLTLGDVVINIPSAGVYAFPLGTEDAGGLLLQESDTRKLAMTGANPTAGTMALILAGEIIPQTGAW